METFSNKELDVSELPKIEEQQYEPLHKSYLTNPESVLEGQLKNLRKRLFLIRAMQLFGVVSLLLCVLAMFFIYLHVNEWGGITFGISLVLLIISLFISVREIQLSTKALDLELSDMELGSKLKF